MSCSRAIGFHIPIWLREVCQKISTIVHRTSDIPSVHAAPAGDTARPAIAVAALTHAKREG